MKISKFGEKNKLSIDALRHYMDIGLLFPEKKGGHYFFDDSCQKDLNMILELKEMGFSLSEVKTIRTFSYLGKLSPYEESSYYQSLFKEKSRKIEEEIKVLSHAKEKLDLRIAEYSEKEIQQKVTLGIDLMNLDVLSCLRCKGPLTVENGSISRNQLIDGELVCNCGESYIVKSGVLIVGEPFESNELSDEDQFISDYILNTDAAYVENVQKGLQLVKRRVEELNLEGKVVLETGSGIGFMLRTLYSELPDHCLYIAVDYNLQKQLFLKALLERTGMRKNILFICSDFSSIPIKKSTADVILDHGGTSGYSFGHKEFLLKEINHHVKREAYLIGTFITFKNFSTKSKIQPEYRHFLRRENIRAEIENLEYTILEEVESNLLNKGGLYEDYFVQGEKVSAYMCLAKR